MKPKKHREWSVYVDSPGRKVETYTAIKVREVIE